MRIGIDAWIIQDGNYPDFSVGETRDFALEFYAKSFLISKVGTPSCIHLKNGMYDISAQITFKKENFTIIDFGYFAYAEEEINADVGDWITGHIYIGVDPFMYFETWEQQPDVPKIRNTWRINSIYLETTPRIEEKPKYFVRDETRFSEVEVSKTNAWNDDEGHASYTLECTKINKV